MESKSHEIKIFLLKLYKVPVKKVDKLILYNGVLIKKNSIYNYVFFITLLNKKKLPMLFLR